MPSKTLTTLVRVAKHKVEQVQQKLAAATAVLKDLEAQKAAWFAKLAAAEKEAQAQAASNTYAIPDTLAFAKKVHQQAAQLTQKITAQIEVVERIRQTLQKEYAARERYQHIHTLQQEAEAKTHAQKVQNDLDDRAGAAHRRAQKES